MKKQKLQNKGGQQKAAHGKSEARMEMPKLAEKMFYMLRNKTQGAAFPDTVMISVKRDNVFRKQKGHGKANTED